MRPAKPAIAYLSARPITESPNASAVQYPIGLSRAFETYVISRDSVALPTEVAAVVRDVRLPSLGGMSRSRWGGRIGAIPQFVELMVRLRADVGLSALCTGVDEASTIAGTILRSYYRMPWVSLCWDHPWPVQAEEDTLKARLLRGCRAAVLKSALTTCDLMCANIHPELLTHLGLLPRRCCVLPNGVDYDRIRCVAGHVHSRRELVGVIANVSEKKGTLEILNAFALVHGRRPDAKLRLIGEVDEGFRSEMEHEIEGLCIRESVELTEWRPYDQALALAAECSVCIYAYRPLPRFYWNYVLKIGEYLALGKPVVAVDTPGSREYIRDGYNGLLVEPMNPSAMAEAIVRLLEVPDLRDRMAQNALASAERYRWSDIHDKRNAAILEVIRRNGGCA